jgi:hypothetical protein
MERWQGEIVSRILPANGSESGPDDDGDENSPQAQPTTIPSASSPQGRSGQNVVHNKYSYQHLASNSLGIQPG